jgi:fused signal recognition particle receptor
MLIPILLAVAVVVALIVVFALRKPAPTASEKGPSKGAPSTKPSTPKADRDAEKSAQKAESKKDSVKPAAAPEPRLETPRPPVPKSVKTDPGEESFGKPAAYDPIVVRKGLAKNRGSWISQLASLLLGRKQIDPEVLAKIEEILLTGDVGVKTTQVLVEGLTEKLQRNELDDETKVWDALKKDALTILGTPKHLKIKAKPTVVLLVGVNGAGKTTTIGKLASKLKEQGKSVVMGAGDTFRAAAVDQLKIWGERVGATVVSGKEGGDPSSVLFDAVKRAEELQADVVLCDTAGRLHSKVNLMEELSKIHRTLEKACPGAPHETLLVLDATNGQNGLAQAQKFLETVPLTGVVLTKLDGTAKGGIVLSIAQELKLPVRYIGIGERPADLREFDPTEFVEALFANRENLNEEGQ